MAKNCWKLGENNLDNSTIFLYNILYVVIVEESDHILRRERRRSADYDESAYFNP